MRSSTRSLSDRRRSHPPRPTATSCSSTARNSSDLATKSVSHLSSTMAATPSPRPTATAPWVFSRSERSTDLARPFSRRDLAAASKSPPVSSSARLASIIPAPVAWRSACTSLAVNDMGGGSPRFDRSGTGVLQPSVGASAAGASATGASSVGGPGPPRPEPRPREREPPQRERPVRAPPRPEPRRQGRQRARRAGRKRGGHRAPAGRAAPGGGPRPARRRRGPLRPRCARRGPAAAALPRREAMKRPSSTASAITRHMRLPERMASSLPGMTYWMMSGSQLVSTTAMIGMPSLLASVTPMCSFFVSRMNTASGRLLHLGDAAEVALELLELAAEEEGLLLGHGVELAGRPHAAVLLHLRDALADGLEVREHAAQPALVDVRHADLLGVGLDRVLGLLLRADEEHRCRRRRRGRGRRCRRSRSGSASAAGR